MNILMLILGILLLTLVPYLLGCANGSILVSKYLLKDDIRNHGSGNAGLTNYTRVFGKQHVFWVIAPDVLKGVFGILSGMLAAKLMELGGWDVITTVRGKYIAALFCELGHMFPFNFGFKGGKGILTGGIIAMMISWKVAVVVWGSFLILTALFRYVSLGSISTGFLFPLMCWVLYRDPVAMVFALVVGFLVVFAHRSNISRLIHGNENKLTFHKQKS